jgi:hypothetical protein
MCRRHVVIIGALVQFIGSIAFADRPLNRTEILEIFQKLTSQPRKTWIPHGIIEATHQEYRAAKATDLDEINTQVNQKIQEYRDNPNKRELTEELQKMQLDAIPFNVRYRLSNEYMMNSTEVARFDGDRFYWETNVVSRTDSVKLPQDLQGNFLTEQFNLDWNAGRISAWDGEKYTTYALPGNHAIVDTEGHTPHIINGALTAGIIPWGYGYYTYENLSAAQVSAVERDVGAQPQMHLTVTGPDGSQMLLVLDSQKDYAVVSCSINREDNSVIYSQYDNYKLILGMWVPTTIYIGQYHAGTSKLLAYHLWQFTKISGDVPTIDNFTVEYEPDTLIEYFSYLTDRPLMYCYSQMVDTDFLLAERLAVAANQGIQPQNCATVALKYVVARLGKSATDQQLAQLISEPDKTTSLYAMKGFLQSLGLYCRAGKTDIQTLKSLDKSCEVVLHIPGENHFVVLAGIDNQNVWCIDLANNRFFYRTDLTFFDMDWTEGTALLVSNQPAQIQGNFTEIHDSQLHNTIGASGYTCTRLLQEYGVIFCSYAGGECGGYYEEYYERWGCKADTSGSCTNSIMLRMRDSPCINNAYYPDMCSITGEWTYYYMRACE